MRLFRQASEGPSRPWNVQVFANLPGGEFQYLVVARHRRNFSLRAIHVDGMVAALAQKLAAMTFQMPDEVPPLHAAPSNNGSRITSCPRNSSSANSRLASNTITTASAKLARASSKVAPWVLAPGNSSTNAA